MDQKIANACSREVIRNLHNAKREISRALKEAKTHTPFCSEFERPFKGNTADLQVCSVFDDSHTIFSQGLLVIESKNILVTCGKAPDKNLNFYHIDKNLLITSFGFLSMNHSVCNLKYSEEHEVLLAITLSSYLYVISVKDAKPRTLKTIEKIAKYNCLLMFPIDAFLDQNIQFEVIFFTFKKIINFTLLNIIKVIQ